MFLTATIDNSLDKSRLDQAIVKLKLVESRQKAFSLIISGKVYLNDKKVVKAGSIIRSGEIIKIRKIEDNWVSRGGIKLSKAIESFNLSIKNKVCLDLGSSTGGFTDVLLKKAASKVFCVDVGYGQLDWGIRNNKKVMVLEKTNARFLDESLITEKIDLLVCDVSFISIKKIIPNCIPLLNKFADLIILIKPQFEVGRENISKGGIVKKKEVHEKVCRDIKNWFIKDLNKTVINLKESFILGQKGNKEFFIHIKN